jgi:hypothetical protein
LAVKTTAGNWVIDRMASQLPTVSFTVNFLITDRSLRLPVFKRYGKIIKLHDGVVEEMYRDIVCFNPK